MNHHVHAAWIFLGAGAVLLVLSASPFTTKGVAFVNGPPPAMTGGFGEESCRQCHLDFDLNDAAGSLRLEGIPETYTAGEQYMITIRLTHPQLERGGFELAARFENGPSAGRQA